MIDLRSDTVTKPTKEMLNAMFSAELGDDVYSEDPSINGLERKIAEMFGFEAAVFCPSGTMTNQIAIKTHTIPGDEVICDATSHVYNYEGGGMAFNSGVQVRAVFGEQGRISAKHIEDNIHPPVINLPRTSLVCIENTLNKAGGSFYTLEQIAELSKVCKKHGLPLHVDGARIFNALIETKENPKEYSKYVDSISICFSKGLGAPVGSALLGSKEFIQKARRYRRLFGGGMRQAGILAAAANYALDHHIERLSIDHARAKNIAEVLSKMNFVEHLYNVETNIIIFKLKENVPSETFLNHLKNAGIIANTMGKQTVRFVTHLDLKDEDVQHLIDSIKLFNQSYEI
jgi:threonine aldolase